MDDLYNVDAQGKMTIHLHPGQTRAWDSKARYTFVIAGTQSGKTSFLPMWLDREIRTCGDGDYLAVTATYDLFKLKLLPEMKHYFCDTFGWEYAASDRAIIKEYKPRMFTRIILRSANAPGGLESLTGKAAVLDECGQDDFRLEAWEAVQRRLSLAQGRVLGGTTPYNLGWLKTHIFDKWRAGEKDIAVVQFKSTMNPHFPIAEYDRAKAVMPRWKFEMFYNGEFSRPAGLIYEDFTDLHVIDPVPLDPAWPRYLGVDFGAIHTAKIRMAHDPARNIYYVYDAALDGNMTTEQHAKSVQDEQMIAFGGAASEEQQRWDWQSAGTSVRKPPISDVESQIDRVVKLLKEHRLYVFNTCGGLVEEFRIYSRKLDAQGQPTEEIKDKATFHHLDALRYVVTGVTDDASWLFME